MAFYIDCDEEVFAETDIAALKAAMDTFLVSDVDISIELLFVSDTEIKQLNKDTRGVDKVTDVLSYPTLDGICGKPLYKKDFPYDLDEENRLLIGSVVVCRERARAQAEEYGHSYKRELHYLFVHGIMHCLGYDHIEEQDKILMRQAEEKVLSAMGITR
ncbi:MAG: rRNA maturation RNase YbeY [Clostridia bacterium]|nr:rRNA maturation RNase YbeY [Clostridia bacterium]